MIKSTATIASHYWRRLISKTPRALRHLQKAIGTIGAASVAGIVFINQYGVGTEWKEVLGKIGIVAASMIAGLQFATTQPEIQREIPDENI